MDPTWLSSYNLICVMADIATCLQFSNDLVDTYIDYARMHSKGPNGPDIVAFT